MTSVEKLRKFAEQTVASITQPKGRYFASSRKGENFELKADLNSNSSSAKKDAVKRVIANMTVGKDVSPLFADVLKCMQTDDIELKKLVYLYLMNHAKTQPELVILAVNTFCKDTEDRNPLIRALAIRTMGCIRVERILDYISEPLRKGLHDLNPYVRKTAAIAVAKLYDLSPSLAEEHGLITRLQDLLTDQNPFVVANAVAALSEINEKAPERNLFTVHSTNLSKLLSSLNECTEWGQVTILDAIALYEPLNEFEAEMVIDKTVPRLIHANQGIVLSAIKVLVIYLEKVVSNQELVKQITKKMISPLMSLFNGPPEVQYIVLRNVRLLLQRYPGLLVNELRTFFCKFNDPSFVKYEKLHILVSLSDDRNADQILAELKEYTNEVDDDFVRRSVKAIGEVAFHVPGALPKCLVMLMQLMKTKNDHIIQEIVISLKDILRKYGHQQEILIPVLFTTEVVQSFAGFDNDAKASLVWILGEYCHLLENAPQLLNFLIDNFLDEATHVQLQLLTTAVKMYLRMPSFVHDSVHALLQKCTKSCDSADVRDRAFIYWRLLSCDPKYTKEVVLSYKKEVDATMDAKLSDPVRIQKLLGQLSTLASVYHLTPSEMPVSTYTSLGGLAVEHLGGVGSCAQLSPAVQPGSKSGNILDLDFDDGAEQAGTIYHDAHSINSTLHRSPSGASSSAQTYATSSTTVQAPNPSQPGQVVDLLSDDLASLDFSSASPATPANLLPGQERDAFSSLTF